MPPAGQGAEAKHAAGAKLAAEVKERAEAKQGDDAKEVTGAITTSATPSWQGIEQQE